MAEFASKGVGATGVTLGAVALGAALLGNNGCGGNVISNLLGNNCGCNARAAGAELQYVSSLQAENAMLKAENYSDKTSLEAYKQSVADNKELRAEMYAFIKPIAEEAANNRVKLASLESDLKCCCEKQELREQIVMGKIAEVAQAATCGLANANSAIAALQHTVCHITQTIVPASVICPQPMPLNNTWVAPTAAAPTNVNVTGTLAPQVGTCAA